MEPWQEQSSTSHLWPWHGLVGTRRPCSSSQRGTPTSLGYAVGGGDNEGLRAFAAWLTSTHTRRQSVCTDALAPPSARNSFSIWPRRITRSHTRQICSLVAF